jgi:carbon-monoxide dehydrogenase medium subunit
MRVDAPSSLFELRQLLEAAVSTPGQSRLLAGGTDLLVRFHASPELSADLIDLSGIDELKGIIIRDTYLEIGACTTFSEMERHPVIRERCAALARAAALVGSPQIRNLGTIGGNLANASPAADSLPPLCALDATILAENSEGEEIALPAGELATAPGKTGLRQDQYIRAVRIPLHRNTFSYFVKTGSRKAVAISKLSLALAFRHMDAQARIFAGSLGASPVRMRAAEEALERRDWSARNHAAFLDALSASVEENIPGRASLPFKRFAVRGLGDDLWAAVKEAISGE